MWLPPDTDGLDPGYAERDVSDDLDSGELIPVVSGLPRHAQTSAISIANRYVALHVARLRPDAAVVLPVAQFGHLFVARGDIELDGIGALSVGDAVRFIGQKADAPPAPPPTLTTAGHAEVLYWEMHASFDL